MGLFNRNNGSKTNEKTYEINGFVIGVDSHIIYHVPKVQMGTTYIFPNGTTGLAETAISEMRSSRPQQIVVPGSFKKFNIQFINFENLRVIELQEGVEEVKCSFGTTKNAVDIKLPATIKKIGKNNYPIVQNLTLPNGVVEIDPLFASHDTNLLSVNIPGTIKVIPQEAFNQCRNLQSVVFNEGVETSARDVFRGTNNLRTLEIPSTYNGVIDLSMEGRMVSNPRGNSKYDGKNYTEEQNNLLKVTIKRGSKTFEFDIRRGEMPSIEIRQNKIQIKCSSQQQIISIDCESLEQGIYNIDNGNVRMQQQVSSQPTPVKPTITPKTSTQATNQQEELSSKIELIFQKAITENLEDEDFEFAGLYGSDRTQVIQYMRDMFMKQVSLNILRTDYNNINRIFNEAVHMLEQEKNMSTMQDDLNVGGKKR